MIDFLLFALDYVFKNEGGYSNEAGDSGGPTMWGITLVEWERFYNKKMTANDVRYKTKKEDAATIYRSKYWDYAGLDELNNKAVATAIFDQCVNWGVGKGVEMAMTALGRKQEAPVMLTLGEIEALNKANPTEFIQNFATVAKKNYTRIVWLKFWKYWKFKDGWYARADRLRTLTRYV